MRKHWLLFGLLLAVALVPTKPWFLASHLDWSGKVNPPSLPQNHVDPILINPNLLMGVVMGDMWLESHHFWRAKTTPIDKLVG